MGIGALLGPSWTTAAGAVALSALLAGGAGFLKGVSYEKDKAAVALAKVVEKGRQTEADWQTDLEAQNELDQEARARMATAYDRGIARVLANRAPVRLPEAAASACAGASPAQLAGSDAAVAERIGRNARAVQLDLEKARAWIETVTGRSQLTQP